MQAPGLRLKFPVLPGWQGPMPALPRTAVGEPPSGRRPRRPGWGDT